MDGLSLPARSWLFVPATRPERFAKAAASGADRIIIDLEDAVAEEAKCAARHGLAQALLPQGVPLYVRINAFGTKWFEEDIATAAKLQIAGIVLPKAESIGQVVQAAAVLGAEQSIVPIIESAAGLWNVLEIALGPSIERVIFGALDFQGDTGIRASSPDETELAYARSRIVLASRVATIAGAIDAVSTVLDDDVLVTSEAGRSVRFGFAGKLCIHPRQVVPTNRAFLPSSAEQEWAASLLAALAERPEDQRGSFSYRGSMVDKPVIERARLIHAICGSRQ